MAILFNGLRWNENNAEHFLVFYDRLQAQDMCVENENQETERKENLQSEEKKVFGIEVFKAWCCEKALSTAGKFDYLPCGDQSKT